MRVEGRDGGGDEFSGGPINRGLRRGEGRDERFFL
jgi:hypothetical protein